LLEDVLANADDGIYEISVPSDALGVSMRRYLKDRADGEAQSTAAPQQALSMPAELQPVTLMR
jgi:hypothetical protein